MTLQFFIKERPHLVWSTKNYDKLSEAAIVEAVLNFGDFEDINVLIKILGIKKMAAIFRNRSQQPRSNYRPAIKNYFQLFFKKYA